MYSIEACYQPFINLVFIKWKSWAIIWREVLKQWVVYLVRGLFNNTVPTEMTSYSGPIPTLSSYLSARFIVSELIPCRIRSKDLTHSRSRTWNMLWRCKQGSDRGNGCFCEEDNEQRISCSSQEMWMCTLYRNTQLPHLLSTPLHSECS
jgi:hypothetical protein